MWSYGTLRGACAAPAIPSTATRSAHSSDRVFMANRSYATDFCERMGDMKRMLAVLATFLALVVPAAAQIPERLDGALTAIYARNEFSAEVFGPAVWIDN